MPDAPPQSGVTLSPGSEGPEVFDLQEKLRTAGYDPGASDGIFGRSTHNAVRRFQKVNRVPDDGLVTPLIWETLELELATPKGGRRRVREAPAKQSAAKQVTPPKSSTSGAPSATPPSAVGPLSPTLLTLRTQLSGPVTSFQMATALFLAHGTLAGGRAESLRIGEPFSGQRAQTVDDWLAEIRPLFDASAVPTLHTRRAVWGLALVDPALGAELRASGFLDALLEEIKDGEANLTEAGRRLAHPTRRDSSAPVLLDRPAREDSLGREAFAITLAARIIQLRKAVVEPKRSLRTRLLRRPAAEADEEVFDGPFLVHLQGAWGAGKSTLLNFFSRELRNPSPRLAEVVWGPGAQNMPELQRWVVVSFNAWQHQRIAPPWWWLLTSVFHEGARELRAVSRRDWLRFKIRDYAWRLRAHWPSFVIPLVVLAVGALIVWLLATHTSAFENTGDKTLLEFVGSVAGTLAAVFAVAATCWGVVRAARAWMLETTARGADTLMRTTADPMAAVEDRYAFLVKALGHPLAILIDDLDRCKADYVVELLEGIQTLFARVPVTYVVAADSCWLRDSFLQVYEPFVSSATGPGESIGFGFLDKSFQLSTSVPRMRPDVQSRYLKGLLDHNVVASERVERARDDATERLRGVGTREELQEVVAQSDALDEPERQAVREAAALRSVGADLALETEYVLADFADLLEPNPRSMKRLVNAYSFESQLQLLESDWVEADENSTQQLALWTILKLRWPSLADYLTENPASVARVGRKTRLTGVPESLVPFFRSDEVRRVVTGDADDVSAKLDEETLRALVRPPEPRPGESAPPVA